MPAGFGVPAAVVAQFGPSVLAQNDVGVGDTNLVRGQKRTSWANQLGIHAIGGVKLRANLTGHCRGWFRRKMGEIAKAGHPCRGWK